MNSYAFACERPWSHIGTCMVPMLDMLNHRCSSCITTFIHMQSGMGVGMLYKHTHSCLTARAFNLCYLAGGPGWPMPWCPSMRTGPSAAWRSRTYARVKR